MFSKIPESDNYSLPNNTVLKGYHFLSCVHQLGGGLGSSGADVGHEVVAAEHQGFGDENTFCN